VGWRGVEGATRLARPGTSCRLRSPPTARRPSPTEQPWPRSSPARIEGEHGSAPAADDGGLGMIRRIRQVRRKHRV